MQIRKQDYPSDCKIISLQVRAEAGNRCEWCAAPHMAVIKRQDDGTFTVVKWVRETNEDIVEFARLSWARLRSHGLTRIILTVAHLDRNSQNNDRSNLAALCQRCHLRHDILQHIANRRYGRHHAKDHQKKLAL